MMSTKITIMGLVVCAGLSFALGACERGNNQPSAKSPDEQAAQQKTSNAPTTRQGSSAKGSENSRGSTSERTAGDKAVCKLAVKGMVCQGCAKNIEKTLGAKSGVVSVDASFPNKSATITYDSEKISPQNIEEVVDGIEQPDLEAKLVKFSESKSPDR